MGNKMSNFINSENSYEASEKVHSVPFTQISNEFIRNFSISADARLLLIYLISFAPGWKFNDFLIKKEVGVGRDKLERMFGELRKAGYVKNIITPRGTKRIFSRIPEFLGFEKPTPENPGPENPVTENQGSLRISIDKNTDIKNINKKIYKKDFSHSHSCDFLEDEIQKAATFPENQNRSPRIGYKDQGATMSPVRKKNVTTVKNVANLEHLYSKFDEFWNLYPIKVKKSDSKRLYVNIITNNPDLHEKIICAVQDRIESNTVEKEVTGWAPQFPYPATWLRAERWNDITETREQLNEKHRRPKQSIGQQISKVDQYHNTLRIFEEQSLRKQEAIREMRERFERDREGIPD